MGPLGQPSNNNTNEQKQSSHVHLSFIFLVGWELGSGSTIIRGTITTDFHLVRLYQAYNIRNETSRPLPIPPKFGRNPRGSEGMSGHPYDRRQASDHEYFVKTVMERGKGDENYGSREPVSQA